MVKTNKRVKLLQVEFDNLTFDQTICLVEKNINEKKATHLLGMNADKINELDKEDSNYKRIVLNADIINPDGFSV
ncbi:glycosyltransferase, partial [Enterococcus faecalis]